MRKNSSNDNKIKEQFIKVEEVLKNSGKNNFEKQEIRDRAWLLLQENEQYYKNVFRKRMREINARFDEGEFADCFFNTIYGILNRYDPEKGNLENFFNSRWSYRLQDAVKDVNEWNNLEPLEHIDNNEKYKEEGEKKRKKQLKNFNLPPDNKVEDEDTIADTLVELLNAITHLNEHKSGKTPRKKYFKMFFTDFITEYCKSFSISWAMKNREKSIFAGLQIDFLDFYMREHCRTFKKIQKVPLKNMGELNGEENDKEIKLPLPNQVYILYLELASSGNVTQMRNKYRDFCNELSIREKLLD